MGYYTFYSLEVIPVEKTDEIRKAIEDKSQYGSDLFEESHKWYDHEEDCTEVSKQFPDVTFAITGDGEEQGDIWRKAFYGGKMFKQESPPKFLFPPLTPPEF